MIDIHEPNHLLIIFIIAAAAFIGLHTVATYQTEAPARYSCFSESDCVPLEVCHPTDCVAQGYEEQGEGLCTQSCSGPLDCNAGRCGCVQGRCKIVPA